MIRSILPWALMTVAGMVLAAIQLGDGLIIERPEARLPLFLGGTVITMAGLLKAIAVATDPDVRHRREGNPGD